MIWFAWLLSTVGNGEPGSQASGSAKIRTSPRALTPLMLGDAVQPLHVTPDPPAMPIITLFDFSQSPYWMAPRRNTCRKPFPNIAGDIYFVKVHNLRK